MNTHPKPTFEHTDLSHLRGLSVAYLLALAENHPEIVPNLKPLIYEWFSRFEQQAIIDKLDQIQAAAGLERLWGMTRSGKPETIAIAAPVEECLQSNTIAGDPELARLAIGLKQSPQLRVYLVLLQMVRETNINHVLRADLAARLRQQGITITEGARRWLYRGDGVFWHLSETHVHLIGQVKAALNLVEMAVNHDLPDLIGTNRPGKRNMYFDVSGSLQQFEANVYAAWYASRENPTIARSTLSALWRREPRILRKWEKLARVEVITNEAQYAPEHFADVPEHAYMYQAAAGEGHTESRFRARIVNTYHAPAIKQHPKRGQSRRVFQAVSRYLESIEPAGKCEQGEGSNTLTGGLKPTGRRYFADGTKARRSAKHLGNRERYIALGTDTHDRAIFDYAPDGIQRTVLGEELPLITQRRFTSRPVYAKDVIYA